MKAVILAGGLGTRLSEETVTRPKPMVEIGGRPILWHILKIYSSHGINDFVICAGYKGYVIKEYFANYFLHMSDVTFDMKENRMEVHSKRSEPWRVTIVDTGDETLTGGRMKRIAPFVDGTFCMTYGDGLADVNVAESIEYHRKQGLKATLTAVQPLGRFGALGLAAGKVASFQEKPRGDGSWINGGFFVLEPSVFDYVDGDDTLWEKRPMETLSNEGQLAAYQHNGFWQPMDTLRDKLLLERLWEEEKAPWKTW
ncbi:MAG: glucose-1-phosphate cytidylyltransferase [Verrucomicrobia bacterium]|nr:glucose-1-phosphate cytidylyltransferase [Verrucomicrobiota bacterium]